MLKRIRNTLLSFPCDSWSNTLCGACAFASYLVFKLAKKNGFSVVFRKGTAKNFMGEHCWCLVNGYVVDITASQFWDLRDREIVIEETEEIYSSLGFQTVSIIDEPSIINSVRDWEDQAIDYCLKHYSKQMNELWLSLPALQKVGCTE